MTSNKSNRDWNSILLLPLVAGVTCCCFGPWASQSSASFSAVSPAELAELTANPSDSDALPEVEAKTLEDWRYTAFKTRRSRRFGVYRGDSFDKYGSRFRGRGSRGWASKDGQHNSSRGGRSRGRFTNRQSFGGFSPRFAGFSSRFGRGSHRFGDFSGSTFGFSRGFAGYSRGFAGYSRGFGGFGGFSRGFAGYSRGFGGFAGYSRGFAGYSRGFAGYSRGFGGFGGYSRGFGGFSRGFAFVSVSSRFSRSFGFSPSFDHSGGFAGMSERFSGGFNDFSSTGGFDHFSNFSTGGRFKFAFVRAFTFVNVDPQFIRRFVFEQLNQDPFAFADLGSDPFAPAPFDPAPSTPTPQPEAGPASTGGSVPVAVQTPVPQPVPGPTAPQPQFGAPAAPPVTDFGSELPRRVVVIVKQIVIVQPVVIVQSPSSPDC